MEKLILLGGGGHCKSCIDVIEQEARYEIVGILDDEKFIGEKLLGYPFIGTDSDIAEHANKGNKFLITVGQIKSSLIRKKIFSMLCENNAQLATVISPRAYVSKHAEVGKGTVIMHDALINAGASIGNNCIINSKALIEHDCDVGDICHISTGAIVNGGTTIMSNSFVGSNSVTKDNIVISHDSFIKAGSITK